MERVQKHRLVITFFVSARQSQGELNQGTGGTQLCGSNSAILSARCVGSRVRTSLGMRMGRAH